MNTKIRVKTQKVNDKISDKTKHIMKISHINLNIDITAIFLKVALNTTNQPTDYTYTGI